MAMSAEKVLATALAELNSGAIHHQVRAHLLTMLPSGQVSRAAVAERMHMTVRTLQRRLELAQNLLGDPEHDVQDVAFNLRGCAAEGGDSVLEERRSEKWTGAAALQPPIPLPRSLLGFAEISNFIRAFWRWIGQAPSAWREHSQLSLH